MSRPDVGTGARVFAVTDTALQMTWHDVPPGPVRLTAGPTEASVDHPGGPGELRVEGLAPWTGVDVTLWHGRRPVHRARVRTQAPPPGDELFRFATVSDLHLGTHRFGYFGTMRERPEPAEPHPVRCTRRALTEAAAWGAQLLVVKGDVTNDGRREEWELAGDVLAEAHATVVALPGNHDARPVDRSVGPIKRAIWYLRGGIVHVLVGHVPEGEPIAVAEGMALAGIAAADAVDGGVSVVDRPGVRIVLADTTVQRRHLGTFARTAALVIDAAADARGSGLPVFVAGHHYPMPFAVPHFWPPGVPGPEARGFFERLRQANPAAFYTAGHTHRHRHYRVAGIPVTEVGSPKDYPGTWAAYTVYEGGIRQTVWRVGSADVLGWTEHSRRAALGAWGLWSPGRLTDRCFLHRWPA